jgi:uncharacterized NAD-dependent epimerase/dehydratase family protein
VRLTHAGRYSPRELIAAREAFVCADTPIDAARSLPSYGPEWDAAIELGVDVMMILHNLELSPQQRLEQAAQHQRFIDEVQCRTVPHELREQLERERLWEKIDALGGPDPAWSDELRRRPDELRSSVEGRGR